MNRTSKFIQKSRRLLLLVALLVTANNPLLAYDFFATNADGDTIYYNILSSTEVEVTNSTYTGTINIPNSVVYNDTTYNVTSIGNHAFYYCRNLTEITIPDSVTSIGAYAFFSCENLVSVEFPDREISIGNAAFFGCTSLATLSIPNGVTSISDSAFFGCTSLTTLSIPNNVTSIGIFAFFDCIGLTTVSFATPSSLTIVGEGAFCGSNTPNDRNIRLMELPNSVTTIGNRYYDNVFAMVEYLVYGGSAGSEDDTWGAAYRVGAMDDDFFYVDANKTKLLTARDVNITTAIIPASVTEITANAFKGFPNLSTVIVPGNVMLINDSVFMGCTSLDSISLGGGLYSIGKDVFSGCSGLRAITSHRVVPPIIAEPAFTGVNKGIPVHVPANSVEAYQAANGWREFFNYQNDAVSIRDTEHSLISVRSMTGAIVLDAAEGRSVCVYNVQGSLVWQGNAIGKQRIDVPSSGLYLVVVEGLPTQKVIVTK